jgi:NAD+ kinase
VTTSAPHLALRRIGVVLHPTRDVRAPLAAIGRWGRRAGVRVVAAPVRGPLPPGVDPVPETGLARPGGILLALGGDGTMLHALAAGAAHGVPALGVKLGHVSYLAEVEPAGLPAALDALAAHRFAIEERSVLAVRNGAAAVPAVNDVVLRRASGAPLADVGLHVGGEEVARYRGDGVIVATPTGSTAYSLSAGGPLVSPRLAATIVTPLAARGAPARVVVLSAGEPVELRVQDGSPPLAVEIDGRERYVAPPLARLRIDQSGPCCLLIRLGRPRFLPPA